MKREFTIKDIRKKFKDETGKDAMVVSIQEDHYLSGYPKKKTVITFNPAYTIWLENFLLKKNSV